MLNPSEVTRSCHLRARFEKIEIFSSESYEPVILARNDPQVLSTDKKVSKLPSSFSSEANAKEGITEARQINDIISSAMILFFFKFCLLLWIPAVFFRKQGGPFGRT